MHYCVILLQNEWANKQKNAIRLSPQLQKSLQHLIDLKIVQEMTGKERHRFYQYGKYLKILEQEIGDFRKR